MSIYSKELLPDNQSRKTLFETERELEYNNQD